MIKVTAFQNAWCPNVSLIKRLCGRSAQRPTKIFQTPLGFLFLLPALLRRIAAIIKVKRCMMPRCQGIAESAKPAAQIVKARRLHSADAPPICFKDSLAVET